MVFYLTIWSLVALASFFDVTTLSLKKKKMIALGIFSLSVVLGATRNQVGTDWEQYYYLFVHNTSFADYFEVNTVYETGYMALNYIAHLISDEYVMLLFLMTLIICVLKYKTFFAIAQYPLVVIMLDYSYNLGNIFLSFFNWAVKKMVDKTSGFAHTYSLWTTQVCNWNRCILRFICTI